MAKKYQSFNSAEINTVSGNLTIVCNDKPLKLSSVCSYLQLHTMTWILSGYCFGGAACSSRLLLWLIGGISSRIKQLFSTNKFWQPITSVKKAQHGEFSSHRAAYLLAEVGEDKPGRKREHSQNMCCYTANCSAWMLLLSRVSWMCKASLCHGQTCLMNIPS